MGLLSNYRRAVGVPQVYDPEQRPTAISSPRRATSSIRLPNRTASLPTPDRFVPARIEPVKALDEWTMAGAGFIGEAMQVPGRIAEMPFSLLNQGIQSLTGAVFGGEGFDTAKAIGETWVGDVFRETGKGVENVMNFPSAMLNAQDTELIYMYRNMPDNFVIPNEHPDGKPRARENTEGGILGALPFVGGLFGRNKTIGELRDELRVRGFTDEDFNDLATGKKGVFDYGDRLTNDNLLIGLGYNLIADPTNLLFGVGAGAKMAALPGKLASMGGRFGRMGRGVEAAAKSGDTAFDIAAKAGAKPTPVPSAVNLAKEMHNGRYTQVLVGTREYADQMVNNMMRHGYNFGELTKLTGVAKAAAATGKFFIDPRGYMTRTGYFKRSAALYGGSLAATMLPDGIADGLQSFAQESLDRRPMSNNVAFMLGAAVSIPMGDMVKMMPEYWNASITRTFNNSLAPSAAKMFGMDIGALRKRVGGDLFDQMVMGSAVNLMKKRGIALDEPLLAAIQSMQERGDTGLTVSRNLYVLMEAHVRTGKLRGDDIMLQVKEDFMNASSLRGQEIVLPDGKKIVLEDLPTEIPFSPELWISRTVGYGKSLKVLNEALKGMPKTVRDKVTIGLRATYTREQMDILMKVVDGLDQGGQIPIADVRAFLTANQLVFRMFNREKFAEFIADFPRDTVNTSTLRKLLEQSKNHADTPTNDMYYWKDIEYQNEAIFQQPDGPLQKKLASLAAKINATLDPKTGLVKPRYRRQNEIYTKRLREEVAWRVEKGDSLGAASPRVVAQSLRAQILRLEQHSQIVTPSKNFGRVFDHDAFNAALAASKYSENLTRHSAADFAGSRAFLTPEGDAGFMISAAGDLQNVFNNSSRRGLGKEAVRDAIALGARTLDAYDGKLPKYYAQFGFREVARMKFNDALAPDGYDFAKLGRPDVVFMALVDNPKPYRKTKRFTEDWDGAKALSQKKATAPEAVNPFEQQLTDLRQSERYFINRSKGGSGAKSHPEFMKDLDAANDSIFRIPKLEEAIVKHVPDWYRAEMQKMTEEVWALGPEYTVQLAPKDAYLYRPGDSLPQSMYKQHNLVARVLYDHNIFGAPARVMDFLLRPVGSSQMLADAERAIMNEYIGAGAKPEQIKAFLTALRKEAVEKHAVVEKLGYRMYGSVKALLPSDVNRMAKEAFGETSRVHEVIGAANHHRVIDRAGSRILRNLRDRNSQRQKSGRLMSLVNDRFWNVAEDVFYTYKSSGVTRGRGVDKAPRDIKSISPALTGSRLIGNSLYHVFRFLLDPRWHLMNRLEHIIIGTVRDGMGARASTPSPAFRRTSGMNAQFSTDPGTAIAAAGRGNRPSYLVDAAETGMFHGNRAVIGRIAKTFDKERPESVFRVLEDLDQADPSLVKLRRDFGGVDNRTLAEMLDEQWFNFDRQGVGKTVREEYAQLFKDEPQTAQAMAEQSLVVQRVTEANQKLYDDLIATYLGNPNRSTLERVMNSYWLYWPLSYQIKASKWLVRSLTVQAFGNNTNMLGLFQYGQLKEFFLDQLAYNEDFAQQWDGQEHLWQTAAMFFPITPEDIGVSLSRPLRSIGGMVAPAWFEPTFGSRDPLAALAYTFEIGPLYTTRLVRSLSQTIWPEPPDMALIEPQIPDIDVDEFATYMPPK